MACAASMLEIGLIEGECYDPDIQAFARCDDEMVLFCAPTHPLAGRKDVNPEQLAQQDWILREPGSGTRAPFDRAVTGRAEGRAERSSWSWSTTMISGGGMHGIGWPVRLPLHRARHRLRSSQTRRRRYSQRACRPPRLLPPHHRYRRARTTPGAIPTGTDPPTRRSAARRPAPPDRPGNAAIAGWPIRTARQMAACHPLPRNGDSVSQSLARSGLRTSYPRTILDELLRG